MPKTTVSDTELLDALDSMVRRTEVKFVMAAQGHPDSKIHAQYWVTPKDSLNQSMRVCSGASLRDVISTILKSNAIDRLTT